MSITSKLFKAGILKKGYDYAKKHWGNKDKNKSAPVDQSSSVRNNRLPN